MHLLVFFSKQSLLMFFFRHWNTKCHSRKTPCTKKTSYSLRKFIFRIQVSILCWTENQPFNLNNSTAKKLCYFSELENISDHFIFMSFIFLKSRSPWNIALIYEGKHSHKTKYSQCYSKKACIGVQLEIHVFSNDIFIAYVRTPFFYNL